MDPAKLVVLFLDANVFLHAKPVDQIDWPTLVDADEVSLVVSDEVVGELDKYKDMGRDRVRDRARGAVKLLLRFAHDAGAELRSKVHLTFRESPLQFDYLSASLDPARVDDRIIANLMSYCRDFPERDVRIVTWDTGLKLKAIRRRIPILELPDTYSAVTSAPVEAAREAAATIPKMLVSFVNGEDTCEATFEPETPINIRTMRRHINTVIAPQFNLAEPSTISAELREHWAAEPSTKDLLPIMELLNQAQRWLHTRKRADVSAYLEQYLVYWTAFIEYQNLCRRSRTIRLIVSNVGTAPAEEVHVFVRIPKTLVAYSTVMKFPSPPKAPAVPGTPAKARAATTDRTMPQVKVPVETSATLIGQRVLATSTELIYRAPKVNQHVFVPLPEWAFSFKSHREIRPFEIHYEATAVNIPTKASGRLLFKAAPPSEPAPNLSKRQKR